VLLRVLGANIIGPPGRLHKQHEAMIGDRNVLKPRLPLVLVPGMFLNHCFYLLDDRWILLLEDLVSDGGGEHMARDVPGGSGEGQSDKREKYEGCD
jgi:hypothetical protein